MNVWDTLKACKNQQMFHFRSPLIVPSPMKQYIYLMQVEHLRVINKVRCKSLLKWLVSHLQLVLYPAHGIDLALEILLLCLCCDIQTVT